MIAARTRRRTSSSPLVVSSENLEWVLAGVRRVLDGVLMDVAQSLCRKTDAEIMAMDAVEVRCRVNVARKGKKQFVRRVKKTSKVGRDRK